MYGLLGMTFKMKLSTRDPEKFMGEIAEWDRAEASLKAALDNFAASPGGTPWEYNHGDAAFYGPKIDIKISDSMKREWQCATLQLDFQLPKNFGLEYMTSEMAVKAKPEAEGQKKIDGAETGVSGKDKESKKEKAKALTPGCARPVMIHRAMAGSIERFVAVLIEHFGGKWPFWLSPRQILIVPVGVGFYEYAQEVQGIFRKQHMFVDVDLSGNTLQKKIRTGQLAQYNFIFGRSTNHPSKK
jgi:threonyl-tRNA synthetase